MDLHQGLNSSSPAYSAELPLLYTISKLTCAFLWNKFDLHDNEPLGGTHSHVILYKDSFWRSQTANPKWPIKWSQ